MRRTAKKNRATVSADEVEIVRKNMYVDDVLTSAPDIDYAVRLGHNAEELLQSRGFELAMLSNNLSEVLEALPADCLASELSQVDLYADIQKQRMVGLVRYFQEDVLG